MSDFSVQLVRVGVVEKHPKADTLSITTVQGVPCIFKTGTFKEGDTAIYVPMDAMVPTADPRFSFLKKEGDTKTHVRLRPVRLRGMYSEGLLVPNNGPAVSGTDLAKTLNIHKYEPPVNDSGLIAFKGTQAPKPPVQSPTYGLNHFLRLADVAFVEGEDVVVTEKIHGCNARYVVTKGKLHVGSHTVWRKDPDAKPTLWARFLGLFKKHAPSPTHKLDPWWKVAKDYEMESKLHNAQGMVLYGEIYGHVQDLTYSVVPKQVVQFVAFDVYDSKKGRWLTYSEFFDFCQRRSIPRVPLLYRGPYKRESMKLLASGKSRLDGVTMREGCVVRRDDGPLKPREVLKLVSEEYKLRKDGSEFH